MALQCSVLGVVLFLCMCSVFLSFFFRESPLMSLDPSSSFSTTWRTLPSPCRCTTLLPAPSDKVSGDQWQMQSECPPTLSLDRWPPDRFCGLTHQTSLREQCTWPLGWSWHVTLCTPSSRSSMWITMTSCPTRSSSESWRTGCTEEPGWETADWTVDVYKMGLGVKIRGICFWGGRCLQFLIEKKN